MKGSSEESRNRLDQIIQQRFQQMELTPPEHVWKRLETSLIVHRVWDRLSVQLQAHARFTRKSRWFSPVSGLLTGIILWLGSMAPVNETHWKGVIPVQSGTPVLALQPVPSHVPSPSGSASGSSSGVQSHPPHPADGAIFKGSSGSPENLNSPLPQKEPGHVTSGHATSYTPATTTTTTTTIRPSSSFSISGSTPTATPPYASRLNFRTFPGSLTPVLRAGTFQNIQSGRGLTLEPRWYVSAGNTVMFLIPQKSDQTSLTWLQMTGISGLDLAISREQYAYRLRHVLELGWISARTENRLFSEGRWIQVSVYAWWTRIAGGVWWEMVRGVHMSQWIGAGVELWFRMWERVYPLSPDGRSLRLVVPAFHIGIQHEFRNVPPLLSPLFVEGGIRVVPVNVFRKPSGLYAIPLTGYLRVRIPLSPVDKVFQKFCTFRNRKTH